MELPSSIPPKPNTSLYNMIRYRGRKRWNLVRNCIEHFSKPSEIVLDPFAGCGVAAIESLKTGRKTIYNDLNPLAYLFAICSSRPIDEKSLKDVFEKLQKTLKKDKYFVRVDKEKRSINMNWLYTTTCPSCGRDATIREVLWSMKYEIEPGTEERVGELARTKKTKSAQRAPIVYKIIQENQPILHIDLVEKCKNKLKTVPWAVSKIVDLMEDHELVKASGEEPIRISFTCKCGAKSKDPDENDLKKLAEIKNMEPEYYYPNEELSYPSGKRFLTKRRVEKISELYVKRTLLALSIVRREMERVSTEENKQVMDLTFVALVYRTTKPESVNRAWMEYWVPRTYLELNVLNALKERCRRILAGVREINNEIKPFYEGAESVDEIAKGKASALFLCCDARRLNLGENVVDYVFTDPSYGEAVQYFELFLVGASWLKMRLPFENEIIVNPMQNKDPNRYKKMLHESFKRTFKALKPSKFMTVTFHSPDIRYWNALMYAISASGFEYTGAVYQSHARVYTNWMMAKDKPGTMLGDMYITFQKPTDVPTKKLKEVNVERVVQEVILPEARKIIMERGGYATYDQLVRGITLVLLEKGFLHRPEIVDVNYEKLFDENFERVK